MKLVKMSLAAALMLSASAYAIDNVKVSGDAKLYYGTKNDKLGATKNDSLFGNDNSFADTAIRVGVTGDLVKGVSFGVTGYAVSTLGLENNLVANTWTGAHTVGNGVNDAAWLGEAWLAGTVGKSTAKLGRMELDTPLAFSETWSVVPNTFEAAVLINQDLPDTTLVGAWVGKGNGYNLGQGTLAGIGYANAAAVGADGILADGANFGTFANAGAYTIAAVNNSFKPLVAQAWYYNVIDVANAYWLQADWDCQLVKDVKLGLQLAEISPKGNLNGANDSKAWAVKAAYKGIDKLNVSAAYSATDKDGVVSIANVATNLQNSAQSKLYTEAYWNYGYVGYAGAKSVNLTAEYDAGIAQLGAYYTHVKEEKVSVADLEEIALSATKSFGPLDATLAYISTDTTNTISNVKELNGGKRYDMVLAMFKLNF